MLLTQDLELKVHVVLPSFIHCLAFVSSSIFFLHSCNLQHLSSWQDINTSLWMCSIQHHSQTIGWLHQHRVEQVRGIPLYLRGLSLHCQRWVSVHPCTSWASAEGWRCSRRTRWLDGSGPPPPSPPYRPCRRLRARGPRLLLCYSLGGRLEELR